ncbi:hypothetical protein GCM10009090_10620 [[Pseudomonas] boreopolis]|uniref:Uncharacterized protein n=1 Tax=Xanthomonas boreopolis TaxID=86183 RepID=A0A919F680_9XANT|nr:hypothetical protein GCM10009090_10620 [[Pseudomonas] boreopolis]
MCKEVTILAMPSQYRAMTYGTVAGADRSWWKAFDGNAAPSAAGLRREPVLA